MVWLSRKWPALVGIAGFVFVTALIWKEISVRDIGNSTTDEDAFGMAFTLLILFWWGYFLAIGIATWFIASWLKSRSIWLLLFAPAIAIWATNTAVHVGSSDFAIGDFATSFLAFSSVAALPILFGASSHISAYIFNFRHLKSAVD